VHDLVEAPLEESHDAFIHEESPNLSFDDNVIPNPLDHSHVSPMCSQPSPYPECDIVELVDNSMIYNANIDFDYDGNEFNVLGGNVDDYVSLVYFRGYDPSIDPYCVFLEDLPRKIM